VRNVLVSALAAVAVGGCGGGTASQRPAPAAPVSEAGSARVEAVLRPSIVPGLEFTVRATGVFDYRRGRLEVRWEDDDGGSGREIVVDDFWYSEIPEVNRTANGKAWLRASATGRCDYGKPRTRLLVYGLSASWFGDPALFGDPGLILEDLRRFGASPAAVGREDVHGVPATRYTARLDVRRAVAITLGESGWSPAAIDCVSGNAPEEPLDVEVWVGDDGLARRVRSVLEYRVDDDPAAELERDVATFDFFDFGAPVRVESPPAADVLDASELGHEDRIEEARASGPFSWSRA
jgi:hypothetical protein